MTFNNRVYVYGVDYDGSKEFITTELDKRGARSYAHKFMKLFQHRFDHMIIGTITEIQDGGFEVIKEEDQT